MKDGRGLPLPNDLVFQKDLQRTKAMSTPTTARMRSEIAGNALTNLSCAEIF